MRKRTAHRAAELPRPIAADAEIAEPPTTDPFDEIDFGSFFDDYLDPGYKSPASESVEKPSFETFLSQPSNPARSSSLAVERQPALGRCCATPPNRSSAIWMRTDTSSHRSTRSPTMGEHKRERHGAGAQGRAVARSRRRGRARSARSACCCRSKACNGEGGVAWQIVSNHMRLLETRQFRNWPRCWAGRRSISRSPLHVIRQLNPRPGMRYSGPGARAVEPDVYFIQGRRRLHHPDERRRDCRSFA